MNNELTNQSIEELEKKYLSIIKKIFLDTLPLNEYNIFLFGSRAERNHRRRSDADVGVFGKTKLPPLLKAILEEKLDNANVPYRVDIIDFNETNDYFKKEALKKIVVWNHPQNLPLPA
jgi:predicted nucleotidyltransferase